MKSRLIAAVILAASAASALASAAQTVDPKWTRFARNCSDEWFHTPEALDIAENVLLYQKEAGGWPKNVRMHYPMTAEERRKVASEKNSTEASKKSCFDNDATVTELRWLARMYNAVPDERYREAFNRGVDLIFRSQYPHSEAPDTRPGGWTQYYPLRTGYSDFITFNDYLMTNILRFLREIIKGEGVYAALVDEPMKEKARKAYDAGVRCILDCQIKENGVKTFWCAQHDPYTLDPAYGRPHELPSYSGQEGVDIVEFLMEIENPDAEVIDAVESAVRWIDSMAIEGYDLVDVRDAEGQLIDRRLEATPGKRVWGRFIQLGGDVAERVYPAMFDELSARTEKYTDGDSTYIYNLGTNARSSYDPAMAHRPIYSIYDSSMPYLLYRFMYSFDDLPATPDEQNGLTLPLSSLNASRRCRYLFIETAPRRLLEQSYPAWRARLKTT